MLENIEVLCHSCIRMKMEKVIYTDPFKLDEEYNDADIIFITHDHFDHYSKEDIDKVRKEDTVIVIPEKMLDQVLQDGFKKDYIVTVRPNQEYTVSGIKFETVPAYNINKQFHPKENELVGYIIEINNLRYYIAGDTDATPDNKRIKCDVAFVPVGGTYTMDFEEAASLINEIKPKIAVPIHYGTIVGTKQDAAKFIKLINKPIQGVELMKR